MAGETTMTLSVPDGAGAVIETGEFTMGDLRTVLDDMKGGKQPMKETEADKAVRDTAYQVTADELRSFVERFERLEAEKKDLAEQQKEVMAEAKARGYDTKVLRKVIALRKRTADEIAEEEAVFEMYREALGI